MDNWDPKYSHHLQLRAHFSFTMYEHFKL